ncbi:MAG: response regulator transcription factor [Defluviitaleaceae bacterium]|nr:response regulator transcription factor [Defluviitaleaceae bacterium]
MAIKALVIDDDLHIAELISLYLNKEGFETKEVYSGGKALDEFLAYSPEIVLLDVMLPEKDGYEILKEIRKTSKVPVIMLTAKGDTFDKVLGLTLGADDYLVKPFDPKELIARIKAVLRRFESVEVRDDSKITLENLVINPVTHTVTYHGQEIDLPLKEFELLSFFTKHPNQVFTREQLLDKVWGYDFYGDSRTVDVHIKRIREKMDKDDKFSIKTVWGVGYKLDV